jgi:poly-gamma-glutamate capsule biosynthesis protein CapA/YwtB (metallophosphatase superfamily)
MRRHTAGMLLPCRLGAVALLALLAFVPAAVAQEAVQPAAPLPPASQAAQATLRVGAGFIAPGCGTLRAPCMRSSMRSTRVAAVVTPPDAAGLQPMRFERLHRAPGTSRYRAKPSLPTAVDAAGDASLSIARKTALSGPGSWCYRLVVDATATALGATSRWRCVRFRPPITIGWVGDTALGSRAYGLPPGDGRSVFDGVRKELRAPDLMVGNYEGTLSTGGTPRCSGGPLCFIFQAPPRMAGGLAHAGFDVMNLANNHGLDMGANARSQTIAALTRAKVGHTGLPGQVTIRQVADTRVALVGFGFNPPGMMDLDDMSTVHTVLARAARQADVVVAIMHSGTEGAAAARVPSGDEAGRGRTRLFVKTAIDAGADIVFGSGPHVVRGIEQRRGRLAFYSTGNFAGWRQFTRSGSGAQSGIVTVDTAYTGAMERAKWQAVDLRGVGAPYRTSSSQIVRRVRSLSRQDFGARAPRISNSGAITLR